MVANVLWDTHTVYKHKTFPVPNPHVLEASRTYRFLQQTGIKIYTSAPNSQFKVSGKARLKSAMKKKTSALVRETVFKEQLMNRNASDHLSDVVEAVS